MLYCQIVDYGEDSAENKKDSENLFDATDHCRVEINASDMTSEFTESVKYTRRKRDRRNMHKKMGRMKSRHYSDANECSLSKEDVNKSFPVKHELSSISKEPEHVDFYSNNLNISLDTMRQLRVDCNVALVDADKQNILYVSSKYA